ncbi:phage minor capsid protein [Actinoplanes aureus]|uniref:ADP ribosyltransferase domain-containing protein n=1 Tax=Actinoplanes aureus TaxID=2792083 RepID=A0A931C758_9ACTN|nr:phage minor capsid protein [Actinoplanes aureus]MBG0560718.1 hypothetical protein [Actinoplanes aureus]
MAVDPDKIVEIAQATVSLYRAAEHALLQLITRQLAQGIDAPGRAVERMTKVGQLRTAAEDVLGQLGDAAPDYVREALAEAYRQGNASVLTDLPAAEAAKLGAADALDTITRTSTVESLAAALVQDVGAKHSNILRNVLDAYRTVIAQATAASTVGGLSRRDAAQLAYARLVDRGLTSFTDRGGRTWRLSSYVEMAVRTVTQRAAVQGQTDRQQRLGLPYVMVSDEAQECELCRPYEGKVLRISAGPTGKVLSYSGPNSAPVTVTVTATLDEARAAGLQHPGCRHSIRTYLPGVTRLPEQPTADPEGDVARQRQRAIERQIRRWKEREEAALSPASRAAARAKVRAWQRAMREHLQANPKLKRQPHREQIGAGNIPPAPPAGATRPNPKPTPPPAPPPPTPAELIEAGDFSGLKRVGPQAGSNPGGLFEADDGTRWYVKAQKSEDHAKNEALASALYREAGIDTPRVIRGRGTPGLDGEHHTASRIVDDAKADLTSRLTDEKYRDQIREGFAVDTWLANWDAVGMTFDNIVTGGDGKPWRIDLGGSLLFRARGTPKGDRFGDEVTEWYSLRHRMTAPQSVQVFGAIRRRILVRSVERVKKITPERIREITAEHGLPDLGDRLIARRDQLVKGLPKLRKEAVRQETFDKGVRKAKKGQDALDAAARRLTDSSKLEPRPDGWTLDKTSQSQVALGRYRGSSYREINEYLRKDGKFNTSMQARIDRISEAIDASPLRDDVLVFRGISGFDTILGTDWNDVDLVGVEWDDKAFASTTADRRVAENSFSVGGNGSVVLRIIMRKGSGAVRLSDLAPPDRRPAGIKEEAELLAGKRQRRRIVADHGIDDRGRRILDVEVIES